jgi:hypothetical protein
VNCYRFIEAEKAGRRNVARACALLKVSRAAFYQHLAGPSRRDRADAGLTEQIRDVHKESKGRYGCPRVHAELRRRGHRHSRKRVARLMRAAGIRGRAPRRWRKTTDTTTCGFPIAINLQDSFVGRVFFDAQGNIQSITIEQNVAGTASAHGVTLPESAHFVDFNNFSTLGAKEVGLSLRIQSGTVVIQNAGYISFNDGSIVFTHGPHPFFTGDTAAFCAALS